MEEPKPFQRTEDRCQRTKYKKYFEAKIKINRRALKTEGSLLSEYLGSVLWNGVMDRHK